MKRILPTFIVILLCLACHSEKSHSPSGSNTFEQLPVTREAYMAECPVSGTVEEIEATLYATLANL